MQCSLFQSLLDQTIESHRDSTSPEVRSHGLTCTNPDCQQAWGEFLLLGHTIPQWSSQLPQVDLTDRVWNELFPPEPVVEFTLPTAPPALKEYFEQSWKDFRSPQQRAWSISLSVAFVMLLVGTLIVSIPHSPTAEVVVRQRHNPAVPSSRDQWASRTPAPPNVAVQSVEWAQKASHVMADVIVSIPEKGADWVPADAWDVDWQHRLEPLRRDAHAAWDALLEKIPMQDQPAS